MSSSLLASIQARSETLSSLPRPKAELAFQQASSVLARTANHSGQDAVLRGQPAHILCKGKQVQDLGRRWLAGRLAPRHEAGFAYISLCSYQKSDAYLSVAIGERCGGRLCGDRRELRRRGQLAAAARGHLPKASALAWRACPRRCINGRAVAWNRPKWKQFLCKYVVACHSSLHKNIMLRYKTIDIYRIQ